MKNWGNWSLQELLNVIEKAQLEGNKIVGIDQEHTDYENDKQVNSWLDSMGYKYKNENESTTIFL